MPLELQIIDNSPSFSEDLTRFIEILWEPHAISLLL
ncbi:hypothetical protein SAMN04515695_5794 [Pseudovibrio sp. Tun.PSC04-5.I4]|nr:hypothetical protein SAMN04515695_5794 [Pseudovibrio sp. Tun.PSC04-5.I4]